MTDIRIIPALQIKDFCNCEPRELVRHQGDALSLVASGKTTETHFAITLPGNNELPRYYTMDDDYHPVISYGQEYFIEVDHTEAIDFSDGTLSGTSGILILDDSTWYLRVAHPKGRPDMGNAYYNLRSGHLGSGPTTPHVARFAKWKLTIATADPLVREALYTFSAK